MSRQTKLSKLAIAAAALLTASVPCLAQNDLNKTKTDSNNVVAVAVSNMPKAEEMTANVESATTTTSDIVSNKTRSTFSAAKFMNATKQSVNSQSLTAMTASSELRVDTWEAPRVDEFAAQKKTRSVEFIPSRGQRIPDKQ